MLAAFACLRTGKQWTAGALVALATAIKAFAVLTIGYLLYRRYWKAALSTFVFLIVLVVVVPFPFRGMERNLKDLQTWIAGMVRYDADSISQRERRGLAGPTTLWSPSLTGFSGPSMLTASVTRHFSSTLQTLTSSTSLW